jgi:hypothetical protein
MAICRTTEMSAERFARRGMQEVQEPPQPKHLLAARHRLARLIVGVMLVLVAFTAGPAVTRRSRAERANRAYGPAQRVAEWLHPGRREAPPLSPVPASELADLRDDGRGNSMVLHITQVPAR